MSLKEELAQEMESTRRDFHHLLDSVPEASYHHPSDNPAWTVGEVLFHMSLAPRFLTADLRLILGQAWIARVMGALVPKSLFDRLNEFFTKRWASRNMTREKLARAYDRRTRPRLARPGESQRGGFRQIARISQIRRTARGCVAVEKLYRYITIHFNAHAGQIRRVIGTDSVHPNPDKVKCRCARIRRVFLHHAREKISRGAPSPAFHSAQDEAPLEMTIVRVFRLSLAVLWSS
jgi:hypothetical protein